MARFIENAWTVLIALGVYNLICVLLNDNVSLIFGIVSLVAGLVLSFVDFFFIKKN